MVMLLFFRPKDDPHGASGVYSLAFSHRRTISIIALTSRQLIGYNGAYSRPLGVPASSIIVDEVG